MRKASCNDRQFLPSFSIKKKVKCMCSKKKCSLATFLFSLAAASNIIGTTPWEVDAADIVLRSWIVATSSGRFQKKRLFRSHGRFGRNSKPDRFSCKKKKNQNKSDNGTLC
jgi:hypothetical protein